MTTVYVSGPMSGYVDFNRPAFDAAAEYLRGKGYDVVNPAALDVTQPLPEEARHADFLRRDIDILVGRCDLILMLPGWKHSKGAQGEKYVADLCGIDELTLADTELWRTFEGDPSEEDTVDGAWTEIGETDDGASISVAPLGTPLFLHSNQGCEVQPILSRQSDEPVRVTHVRRHSDVDCEEVEGDGQGNAWCTHGVQVQYAPELPQASDKFPDVPYVRHMSGCDGKRGGRCSLGLHVVDGLSNLVHIQRPEQGIA